jgi:hypothetical protein
MAIKVTGLFQNPQTKLIYQDPLLTLIPMLEYPGILNLQVRIMINNDNPFGNVSYMNIDKSVLEYPTTNIDPYSDLITALETYVIDNLKNANAINSQSLFEVYTT